MSKRPPSDRHRTGSEVTTVQRALNLLRVLAASEKPIGVNEMGRGIAGNSSTFI